MFNWIYKIYLSVVATSWVIVLYGIKSDWIFDRAFFKFNTWQLGIILIIIPIILSALSLLFLWLKSGNDNLATCKELEEADSSFLPVYLGYFFIGLSVDSLQHLIFVYVIIFSFTCLAQMKYFNPVYLLFGYRYYNIETIKGEKVFLIAKKGLRNAKDANFERLRRINNITYFAWRKQ